MRVAVVGTYLHVNIISQIFNENQFNIRLNAFPRKGIFKMLLNYFKITKNNDILHAIYPSHRLTFKMVKKFQESGKSTILHWIGSDVLLAKYRMLHKKFPDVFNNSINVAVAPWLKDELEDMKIHVDYIIPLVPPELSENNPIPLPKKFRVLYFLPRGKEDFYHHEVTELIAKELPVEIIVVGGGKVRHKKNIREFGWVPRDKMKEIYSKVTVLVRYTKHDGFPLMLLEALGYGRYVIFNKPLQHIIYVKNVSEVIEALRGLLGLHLRKVLRVNSVDLTDYMPSTIAFKIFNLWKKSVKSLSISS